MDNYNELKEKYDTRHGGPFDRGSADSYYHRRANPHYFLGDSYMSKEVSWDQMTPAEVEAYMAGYQYNEKINFKKEWY